MDLQTQAAFNRLFDEDRIQFYLQCKACRFTIPESIHSSLSGRWRTRTDDDGSLMTRSLFDFVENEGTNEYERKLAMCLDKNADVLWWYRNRVGSDQFAIQGYRRHKMYPDFVVQQQSKKQRKFHYVLVVESKGEHLEGNPDTNYKRDVAKFFTRAGKRVSWQKLGADFKDHRFRFQILSENQEHGRNWQDVLNEILAAQD